MSDTPETNNDDATDLTEDTSQTPDPAAANGAAPATLPAHQDDLEEDDVAMPTELDTLKQQATMMGVPFSPNIGLETLRKRINEKLAEGSEPEASAAPTPTPAAPAAAGVTGSVGPVLLTAKTITKDKALALSDAEVREHPEKIRKRIITMRQRHEHLRLVRVQIYNNNPSKNDLFGEIVATANKYVGTVKKFIPFGEGTEEGYHVPAILLGVLRAKKYQKVKVVKNPDGTERVVNQRVPEYTINELPPLTEEQLKELATRQEAAKRVGLM